MEVAPSMLDYLIPGAVALIVSIISALTTVYAVRRQSRVSDQTSLSSATLALLKPYQDEVEKLRKEIEPLKKRIMELEVKLDEVIEGAHKLAIQIRQNGDTPVWEPPKYEVEK